jgi:hypothetical protein
MPVQSACGADSDATHNPQSTDLMNEFFVRPPNLLNRTRCHMFVHNIIIHSQYIGLFVERALHKQHRT